mmetsp:Transcript_46811/g.125498  ORF Transcript_46811/g.125498 Transcript_46811/m.125498 type:complete len:265 (-) Transcript_46811:90-884(-)|eukprot:CAMPEP_0171236904 /NCGR_PEP_ID=MMETSP0790-20130122/42697_1 /TAXON_ID=2925 /ORGANISM="Alexandrium catenella, Strain OF101" /LENGTH=264 /DNA_ID=CAMNT_0011703251 /DNA_START=32 /DNA_END=826 /DNA_ORIENTATION=-
MPWGRDAEADGGGGGGDEPCDTLYAANLPDDFNEEGLKENFGVYGSISWHKIMKTPGKKVACLVQFSSPDDAQFIKENPEVLSFTEPPTISYHRKKAAGGPQTIQPPNKGGGGGGGGGNRSSPYGGGAGMSYGMMPMMPFGPGAMMHAGGQGGLSAGDVGGLKKALSKSKVLPVNIWHKDEGCVFVSGLPLNTSDLDLYELFAPFGAIPPKGVKAMKGPDGNCTGVGFIDFIDPEHAGMAISTLNGFVTQDGTVLRVTQKKKKG